MAQIQFGKVRSDGHGIYRAQVWLELAVALLGPGGRILYFDDEIGRPVTHIDTNIIEAVPHLAKTCTEIAGGGITQYLVNVRSTNSDCLLLHDDAPVVYEPWLGTIGYCPGATDYVDPAVCFV